MKATEEGVVWLIKELEQEKAALPPLPPAPPLPPTSGDGTPGGMDPWQTSVESRLASVDARLVRIETDLSTAKGDIAAIKTDIAVVKVTMATTMATKDDLRALDKAIGTRLQVYLGIVVALLTAVTVGTKLLSGS